MHAAGTLTEPLFPPTGVFGQQYGYESPLRLLQVFVVPWCFARPGFRMFEDMGMCRDLIQTFLDLSEMSQALEICMTQGYNKSVLTAILDSRAHLVYRLLKLPRSAPDAFSHKCPSTTSLFTYRCARSVACLYALHAIFSLPRKSQIKSILVPQITQLIVAFIPLAPNRDQLEFLLWSSMATAAVTACDETSTARWLRGNVLELMKTVDVKSFFEMRSILRTFGWNDAACSGYTNGIWRGFTHNEGRGQSRVL